MTVAESHECVLVAGSISYTVLGYKCNEVTMGIHSALSLRPYLKWRNYVLGPTHSGQRGGGGGGG